MFRSRAIKRMLLEDVAGVPFVSGEDSKDSAPSKRSCADLLARARRKAILVVVLDWIAVLVLVLARSRSTQVLDFGPSENAIFSVGVLAIAAHSGFRLGQIEKLQAVRRVFEELSERSEKSPATPEFR